MKIRFELLEVLREKTEKIIKKNTFGSHKKFPCQIFSTNVKTDFRRNEEELEASTSRKTSNIGTTLTK